MHFLLISPISNGTAIAAIAVPLLTELADKPDHEIIYLCRQVAMLQRQIFGRKSERPLPLPAPEQDVPGEDIDGLVDVVRAPKARVGGHERDVKSGSGQTAADESTLFLDETKVPVETIVVPNPGIIGLTASQYEVIGGKVSHRFAQRAGSCVVLRSVRPVIERHDKQLLFCLPARVVFLMAAVPTSALLPA
jgi:transposase